MESTPLKSPSSPNHHPPTAFPLFPLLPPELRLQIYAFALPSPRLFHFHGSPQSADPDTDTDSSKASYFLFPGLLHVCTESRILALKYYKKCNEADWYEGSITRPRFEFNGDGTNTQPNEEGVEEEEDEGSRYFYFAPSLDIAIFSGSVFSRQTPKPGVKNICLAQGQMLQMGGSDMARNMCFRKIRDAFPDAVRMYVFLEEFKDRRSGCEGFVLALDWSSGVMKSPFV